MFGKPFDLEGPCSSSGSLWGTHCAELGRSVQSGGALGMVGEALGNPRWPRATATAVETNRTRGLGGGDNGQERKCVQTLSWRWGLPGASFHTVSSKTRQQEPSLSCAAQGGVPVRGPQPGAASQTGPRPRAGLLEGGLVALTRLLPAASWASRGSRPGLHSWGGVRAQGLAFQTRSSLPVPTELCPLARAGEGAQRGPGHWPLLHEQ